MNFVQQAIDKGFEVNTGTNRRFNPNDNWFGISVYHPDAVIKKGSKKIVMSLQGMYMKEPQLPSAIVDRGIEDGKDYWYVNDKLVHVSNTGSRTGYVDALIAANDPMMLLVKNRAVKYIRFNEGDTVLYETWTGELPSQEFIDGFINKN